MCHQSHLFLHATCLVIERIEPSPDHQIEDLQPSQEPIIGPGEQAQPRRSERIHLQQEKTLPSGPVTRSQTRKMQKNTTVF